MPAASPGWAKLNRRSPAIDSVPIIKMRMSQTITATNTGTTASRVARLRISLPSELCCSSARETPHQVSMAFMVAARNQAANRYQVSVRSPRAFSGVNSRAMPAKSMPQKAMARMVAQRTPTKRRSPKRLERAKSVVE